MNQLSLVQNGQKTLLGSILMIFHLLRRRPLQGICPYVLNVEQFMLNMNKIANVFPVSQQMMYLPIYRASLY